ncbi:hypothetical protein Golob_018580, partial [Gossypium lobatum]|nr:hypothetical protein [Gossypium lobatum]
QLTYPFHKRVPLPTSHRLKSQRHLESIHHLLNGGFNRLTSLQELSISGEGWPHVVSFPEEGIGMTLPPSLTSIFIQKFENLEFIYICPLLEEGCSRGKGRDWSKVAHIPYVQIVVQTVIPMGLD